MFRANAVYEGLYLLGTSIARPLISKRLVEIARRNRCRCNRLTARQAKATIRFASSWLAYALNPDIKVIAPWREWDLSSRTKLIDFAEKNQIPIAKDKRGEAPFSVDAICCTPRQRVKCWKIQHGCPRIRATSAPCRQKMRPNSRLTSKSALSKVMQFDQRRSMSPPHFNSMIVWRKRHWPA